MNAVFESLFRKDDESSQASTHKDANTGILKKLFNSEPRPEGRHRVTAAEESMLYERPDSFADLLHFSHYDPPTQTFQYPDSKGLICGAMIELIPADAEGRDVEYLLDIRDRVTRVLHGFPEVDGNPWVMQIYVQEEPIAGVSQHVRDYIASHESDTPFREVFTDIFVSHLENMSRRGGLFIDKETKARWGAKNRRVRCVLYRNFPYGERGSRSPEKAVNQICQTVLGGLSSARIEVRRCTGGDMVEWMLPWLSPSPPGGGDGYAYLRNHPYDWRQDDPDFDDALASHDLAEAVLLSPPRSGDEQFGTWYFGQQAHRVITIEKLALSPRLGVTCLEGRGETRSAVLLDLLPENTVIAITTVLKPQDEVRLGIQMTGKASVGDSEISDLAGLESHEALQAMARDRRAYPTWLSVFIRSDDPDQLDDDTADAVTELQGVGLVPIEAEGELIGLSSYVLNLPMGFKPQNEKRTNRLRLQWDKHLANMMPVYGASRGTGNCGMFFLNVNGGPIMIDPLNPADRQMAAHSLILGPTGSGKSAMLVYLCCWLMAVHKPHLYIIDVGDSFGLLGKYLKSQGFTVNHIKMDANSDVSLPPFADAPRVLDGNEGVIEEGGSDDEKRDILMEMEIAAQYLITQGKPEEERRLHAEDRWTIRNAIKLAAERTVKDGRDQTMVDDVVCALRAISNGASFYGSDETLHADRRSRAGEMADAIAVFCTGDAARYFNRPGRGLPEVDVTIVDLEELVTEAGAMPELIVVFMGLMNRINSDISRRRLGGRPTVVINDEAHITTKNPLLASYVVKGSKMWRKKGAWLWMATQDLIDFPDEAAAILNQAEFWFCLSMTSRHVEGIARFKNLTDDEKSLLLSARKQSGVFVDGVILSKRPATLFRSIPPAMCLALALTEQHEAAARANVAREHGCSDLEAVEIIAKTLDERRWGSVA